MVLLPRRGLVELDLRVVAGRGVDEAHESLLQRGVERETGADALLVGREGGLGVVQEGLADRVGRDVVGDEVDAGGHGPLGPLVQKDLGERVGREVARVDGGGVLRVLAHEEAGARRGLEAPGTEVDGLFEDGDLRLGQAGLRELSEERYSLRRGGREVCHVGENTWRISADGGVGEVELGAEGGLVCEGVGREEDGMGELRREANLPQAREDLVEARGVVRGGLGVCVGVVLERAGLEPEPGPARGTGRGWEELELERGQAPAGRKEQTCSTGCKTGNCSLQSRR